MKSFGRLRIVRQIDDGETQSYVVFDPTRGKELLLHLLPAGREKENAAAWERLAKLNIVLEHGDLLGAPYFVTELAEKFTTLADFLERSSGAGACGQEKTPEPGEFTRLFQAPSLPSSTKAVNSVGAGEFTRVFRSDPPKTASPEVHPAPARVAPTSPDLRAASERFTATPAPIFDPSPSAPAKSNSNFAKYYQDPLGKASREVDFNKKPPAPLQPAKKPGNFTQMFGKPFSRDTKQKAAEVRGEPAGATGVFSAGNRPSPAPLGESEYTRVIQSAKPGASSHSSPFPAPVAVEAAAPVATPWPVWIFAILGVLLALAVALVLYVALKN
jgi:hypothetical protein